MDQLLKLFGHDFMVLAANEARPHVPNKRQEIIPSTLSRFYLRKPQLKL